MTPSSELIYVQFHLGLQAAQIKDTLKNPAGKTQELPAHSQDEKYGSITRYIRWAACTHTHMQKRIQIFVLKIKHFKYFNWGKQINIPEL